jgi:hypothetical protein
MVCLISKIQENHQELLKYLKETLDTLPYEDINPSESKVMKVISRFEKSHAGFIQKQWQIPKAICSSKQYSLAT